MSLPRRSRLAPFGLAAALFSLPLAALAEWRDIPYADVVKMPLMLEKVDPQHVFTFRMQARPAKGVAAIPADFRLQVKLGDGKLVPVPVKPDGNIELPVHREWADGGAVLQSNQPKGVVAINMNFDARTPPGTKMSYAQLTEAAPILEKGIAEYAGFMSFMAPDVKTIVLKFAQPGHTAVLSLPDGRKKSWKADARGRIEMPWEKKWLAGTVELSAPLSGIDQILK
jgi:hypothetical protein